MSVRVEKPFEAPGHTIRFGSTVADSHRAQEFWVSCSCGWSSAPETVNAHHHGLARRHLAPFVDHDLEVVESGVYVRAECSCGGWRSDHWHHGTFRGANRFMKGEHAMHCAGVKLLAEGLR